MIFCWGTACQSRISDLETKLRSAQRALALLATLDEVLGYCATLAAGQTRRDQRTVLGRNWLWQATHMVTIWP
jgi:hypothetical protein